MIAGETSPRRGHQDCEFVVVGTGIRLGHISIKCEPCCSALRSVFLSQRYIQFLVAPGTLLPRYPICAIPSFRADDHTRRPNFPGKQDPGPRPLQSLCQRMRKESLRPFSIRLVHEHLGCYLAACQVYLVREGAETNRVSRLSSRIGNHPAFRPRFFIFESRVVSCCHYAHLHLLGLCGFLGLGVAAAVALAVTG